MDNESWQQRLQRPFKTNTLSTQQRITPDDTNQDPNTIMPIPTTSNNNRNLDFNPFNLSNNSNPVQGKSTDSPDYNISSRQGGLVLNSGWTPLEKFLSNPFSAPTPSPCGRGSLQGTSSFSPRASNLNTNTFGVSTSSDPGMHFNLESNQLPQSHSSSSADGEFDWQNLLTGTIGSGLTPGVLGEEGNTGGINDGGGGRGSVTSGPGTSGVGIDGELMKLLGFNSPTNLAPGLGDGGVVWPTMGDGGNGRTNGMGTEGFISGDELLRMEGAGGMGEIAGWNDTGMNPGDSQQFQLGWGGDLMKNWGLSSGNNHDGDEGEGMRMEIDSSDEEEGGRSASPSESGFGEEQERDQRQSNPTSSKETAPKPKGSKRLTLPKNKSKLGKGKTKRKAPAGRDEPAIKKEGEETLPVKKKRGRKPKVKDAEYLEKRKVQNRSAQKSFRERKIKRIQDLETRRRELTSEKASTLSVLNSLRRENQSLLAHPFFARRTTDGQFHNEMPFTTELYNDYDRQGASTFGMNLIAPGFPDFAIPQPPPSKSKSATGSSQSESPSSSSLPAEAAGIDGPNDQETPSSQSLLTGLSLSSAGFGNRPSIPAGPSSATETVGIGTLLGYGSSSVPDISESENSISQSTPTSSMEIMTVGTSMGMSGIESSPSFGSANPFAGNGQAVPFEDTRRGNIESNRTATTGAWIDGSSGSGPPLERTRRLSVPPTVVPLSSQMPGSPRYGSKESKLNSKSGLRTRSESQPQSFNLSNLNASSSSSSLLRRRQVSGQLPLELPRSADFFVSSSSIPVTPLPTTPTTISRSSMSPLSMMREGASSSTDASSERTPVPNDLLQIREDPQTQMAVMPSSRPTSTSPSKKSGYEMHGSSSGNHLNSAIERTDTVPSFEEFANAVASRGRSFSFASKPPGNRKGILERRTGISLGLDHVNRNKNRTNDTFTTSKKNTKIQ